MKKYLCFCFLLTVFLSAQSGRSQNTAGDSTFNSSQIHVIEINFPQSGYWDSLMANKPLDKKMVAHVKINGAQLDSCGVQFKGNSSYNAPGNKKPFKIDFNEYVSGQKYDGLKTINLNNAMKDPTLMREKMFYDFMGRMGFKAPRATYAKLFLNGQYWGLYTLVEQVNKTFLENRFYNDAGNLFKGDPQGSLQFFPQDTSYFSRYELKTNEDSNYWGDLVNLIKKINQTPPNQFYDSLEKVLNTQSVIEGWAANIIYANLDSYQGSGHNYYIYHNTATDKFDWIVWDCNEAFGNFNMNMSISQLENLSLFYVPPGPQNVRPLTVKLIQDPVYKSRYVNLLCQLMEEEFTQNNLFAKIDSLYNRIKPDVYADTLKPYSNQAFENNINAPIGNNIPGLKSFINARRISILDQLALNGCVVGEEAMEKSYSEIEVYPNPNDGVFTMVSNNYPGEICFYTIVGELVLTTSLNSTNELSVNLPAGVYYLKAGTAVSMVSIIK